jgi:hypothetical protein
MMFADPDLTDTHTVSVKLDSALLNDVSINGTVVGADRYEAFVEALKITGFTDSTGSGTGQLTWTLADLEVYLADLVPNGETLVLTYIITVTDSHGATSTQEVVVKIDGNQAAATVWIDTSANGALWSEAANWESDKAPTANDDVFIGTDQVFPKTPTFPAIIDATANAKSLTMNDFANFGNNHPELVVEKTGTLTIAGNLSLDTGSDPTLGLAAQSTIENFGHLSVGGVATLMTTAASRIAGSSSFRAKRWISRSASSIPPSPRSITSKSPPLAPFRSTMARR